MPIASLLLPTLAAANRGLAPEAGEWLWPQLQARITVQTAALAQGGRAATGGLHRLADPSGLAVRAVQGGALFGDYVFASPAFGHFRATSGVLLGAQGGAPLSSLAAPGGSALVSRFSVNMLEGLGAAGAEGPNSLPYLGLGFSTPAPWRSFFLSADLGVVASKPAGLSGLGRALLGNQPMDAAVRDLRLAPVLQFGMRYSF